MGAPKLIDLRERRLQRLQLRPALLLTEDERMELLRKEFPEYFNPDGSPKDFEWHKAALARDRENG